MTPENETASHPRPELMNYRCVVCGHEASPVPGKDLGYARGNTARYADERFPLWRCARCLTIHSLTPVDLAEIYSDYPLNHMRRLDAFARSTMGNLTRRLIRSGLQRCHRVLDFGCGNGLFVEFLTGKGYTKVLGYDPYVSSFARWPAEDAFDCVVCNDVLEHCEDPRKVIRDCLSLLKPGGTLYMGTADAAGVGAMDDLEPHLMRLHQPFHRVILTQASLLGLGAEFHLELVASYRRSYMDTLKPFSNYRFLDDFNRAVGHDLDRALDPSAGRILLRRPGLLVSGLLGYFAPSAFEPAAIWRRP